MAAKGTVAKANVVKKIAAAFGNDFVGEVDKKVYVWAMENGEKIQIAISMTCPKNPIGEAPKVNFDEEVLEDYDFSGDASAANVPPTVFEPAEISDDEKANIAELMKRLGL